MRFYCELGRIFAIFSLALLVPIAPALAVSGLDNCHEVPGDGPKPNVECDIVVNGHALPALPGDDAYSVTSIDETRIQSTASGRIEDALRDVAGLQQFRRTDARSANATSQGATLRGLGGNASSRALLVLDGVPQSDPFGGWVTWPAYAANRVGDIRVTRGGGSVAYGSGALAGTIELDSVSADRGNRVRAGVFHGSRQSIEADARVSARLGNGAAMLSASYARGDGFVPIVRQQRGPADIAAPYEQASFAARGIIALDSDTELQASVLAFTDRRTRGTILSGNGGDGADASIRIVHGRGIGETSWEATAYIQMRKFQSRFVSVDAARATVLQTVDQFNVPSTGTGARFELRPHLSGDFDLRLGGDWRRTVGETNEFFTYVAGLPTRIREAGGSAETLGGFAEVAVPLADRIDLNVSGRTDRWRLGSGQLVERTLATGAFLRNEQASPRSGWEGTGRAGLVWRSANGPTLRAAAYRSWRLPTLNELYRPFRVGADATAANPLLDPERLKGAELGIEKEFILGGPTIPTNPLSSGLAESVSRPRLELGATFFTNRLTNAIANVTLGRGPGNFPGVGFVAAGGAYRQRLNVDAIRSRGIEFDLSFSTGSHPGNITGRLSYAYTDAEVRASGLAAPLNGLRPAQVPKHLASATLDWRWFSLSTRYVSAQFEDDGNTRGLRDAITFDAVVKVPLGRKLNLVARGENLANARVEAAISNAGVIERGTPRTLWIGLNFSGD